MTALQIIGVVVASIATILGGMWGMLRYSAKQGADKNRLDSLEKKCDGLPEKTSMLSVELNKLPCSAHLETIKENKAHLDSHIEKYNSFASDVSGIRVSIDYIQKTIEALSSNVQNMGNPNRIILTETRSPLNLTQKGFETAKEIGLYNMVDENWDKIHALIEANSTSKNPYDIQQFCIVHSSVFPEIFLEEKDLNKIKTEAYKSGMPLIEYMKVFAVIIRNRYFRDHGMDVNDIDRYDPNAKNKEV